MIAVACVDIRNGMMFNHRRQSQDRALRERLLEECSGRRLLMSPYSARQFGDMLPDGVVVAEDFLERAGKHDCCFVEDADLGPVAGDVDELVLFRWNRIYPADRTLPVDLHSWNLVYAEEFPGFSHPEITEERYRPADRTRAAEGSILEGMSRGF